MVAQNEQPVSPTPEPGSEQAIDMAAYRLAAEIKAYAKASPEHGIPAGQRFLLAQTLALDVLIPLLAAVHHELDDVFPVGKSRLERKRDVLMGLLTTYLLPELLESTADTAAITQQSPDDIHAAVFADVDMLWDYTLRRAETAVRQASRTE